MKLTCLVPQNSLWPLCSSSSSVLPGSPRWKLRTTAVSASPRPSWRAGEQSLVQESVLKKKIPQSPVLSSYIQSYKFVMNHFQGYMFNSQQLNPLVFVYFILLLIAGRVKVHHSCRQVLRGQSKFYIRFDTTEGNNSPVTTPLPSRQRNLHCPNVTQQLQMTKHLQTINGVLSNCQDKVPAGRSHNISTFPVPAFVEVKYQCCRVKPHISTCLFFNQKTAGQKLVTLFDTMFSDFHMVVS